MAARMSRIRGVLLPIRKSADGGRVSVRSIDVKYMLLMQFSGAQVDFPPIDTWPAEDVKAHIEFMQDVNGKIIHAGELVDAQGLAMPDQAKIVRAGDGQTPVVSDGPFPRPRSSWPATGSSTARAPSGRSRSPPTSRPRPVPAASR
jgi:hypothetical protein